MNILRLLISFVKAFFSRNFISVLFVALFIMAFICSVLPILLQSTHFFKFFFSNPDYDGPTTPPRFYGYNYYFPITLNRTGKNPNLVENPGYNE